MSEKILASVSGLTITENDVSAYIASLGQRGASYNTPEGRRAVLSQLVNQKQLFLKLREPCAKRSLCLIKISLRIEQEQLLIYKL